MKLDPSHFCHVTNTEFRVLTAIEVGMRNHEYMPIQLISSTANLRSCGMTNVLSSLLKSKLIVHCGKVYDGYKLTFLGLDYLAIRSLFKRGIINSVGRRIGVGKEADVHLCQDAEGNLIVMKLHRLGRISFRSVKANRDYMGRRKHASWMYLSQIAAKKEYSYLLNLYEESFPVPEPIDINRHVIVMRYVDGIPLSQVRDMESPERVLNDLISLIVRLAKMGIIHGDFNGFNLLINEAGTDITVIDFPQVISVTHENAEFYFDRDIKCIVEMFKKKFKMDSFDIPKFSDVVNKEDFENLNTKKMKVDIKQIDNELLEDIFQNLRQEGEREERVALENISDGITNLTLAESSDEDETTSDYESVSEDEVKEKPIQIWSPHVKRIGTAAYGKMLHARARNKAKPETKKNRSKRKAMQAMKNELNGTW